MKRICTLVVASLFAGSAAWADGPIFTSDVEIDNESPDLLFNDTDAGATGWEFCTDNNGCFGKTGDSDQPPESMNLAWEDADPTGNGVPIVVETGTPDDLLYLDSNDFVGINTNTPSSELHVFTQGGDSVPAITLDDGASGIWSIQEWGNGLRFGSDDSGVTAMRMAPNGDVLVGADTCTSGGCPSASEPLHVRRTDGTAQVLVEDTNPGNITMFRLSNNGHPRFRFQNTSGTEARNWEFRTAGDGANEQFQINRITPSEGSSRLMRVLKNGDTEFEGDVTANGILLTSSRESKTDFSQVDEHTVLEKVAALNVSQWRYKREPETERHIGPMAEDFQAVFGLGDGEHISAGDANGILFAATKALKAETSQLEAENQSLKQENRELRDRLERIESKLGMTEQ